MSFCTNQSLTVSDDWWFRVELLLVMVLKGDLFSVCFFLIFVSVPTELLNCVTGFGLMWSKLDTPTQEGEVASPTTS